MKAMVQIHTIKNMDHPLCLFHLDVILYTSMCTWVHLLVHILETF